MKKLYKSIKNRRSVKLWLPYRRDHTMHNRSREGKSVCYLGIRSKFEQHQLLNMVLQNTGSAIIVEHSHDRQWGTGIPLSYQSALDENLWNSLVWMSKILECVGNELSTQCSK